MNIVLMGLRGSGKTTLAPLLAHRLGRPWLDLDVETLAELCAGGMPAQTVTEAWHTYGEPAFRGAETKALARVLKADNQVIALGGGTPTAAGAADLLRAEKESGRVLTVYLRGSAAMLRKRLAATDTGTRPSLTGANPLDEIEAVLAVRDPLYKVLADAVVKVDDLDAQATIAAIISSATHQPKE
jgi:shikimate kinase